jgi:hypothetical protein
MSRQEIDAMKMQIQQLDAKLNKIIAFLDKKETNEANQQVAIRSQINQEVSDAIKSKVEPKLASMARIIEHKTVDEGELITEYRRRVMGQNNVKQITSGDSKHNFQSSTFAFTDND